MYFDQLLGAAHKAHAVYLAQLLGTALLIHSISNHDIFTPQSSWPFPLASVSIFNVSIISCSEADRTSPPHPRICTHNHSTRTQTQSLTTIPQTNWPHTHQPWWQAALNKAASLPLVDSLTTCPGRHKNRLNHLNIGAISVFRSPLYMINPTVFPA